MPSDLDPSAGSPRQKIKQMAEQLDVDEDAVLFQSKRRDPSYKGTSADHKKAEWFARIWRRAVDGRDGETIHIRGVHYFLLMAQDEDFGLNIDSIPIELGVEDLPTLPEDLLSPPTNCSWDRYRNTDACFSYLKEAAKLARILGYIPLDGIVDEKHTQRVVTTYDEHTREVDTAGLDPPSGVRTPPLPDPEDRARLRFDPEETTYAEWAAERIAAELVQEIEFDVPSQAPFHVELWSEKTLPDYIHRIAQEMGVNAVVEGEGDLSLTIAKDFVRRVEAAEKPAVVLYLSDHDPRGSGMAVNMIAKISWLEERGDLSERVFVKQLAVTDEQVQDYGLPTEPVEGGEGSGTGAKAYQTLAETWQARHGEGACELNVLEGIPDLYKHIVREGLHPYVDEDLAARNREAREQWKEEATDCLQKAFKEAGLDGEIDEVEEWVEEFNDRFEDALGVLEELHSHLEHGQLADWRSRVRETVDGVAFPVVTVPDGDGAYPPDPLFDSRRSYLENLRRIQEFQDGAQI